MEGLILDRAFYLVFDKNGGVLDGSFDKNKNLGLYMQVLLSIFLANVVFLPLPMPFFYVFGIYRGEK